MTLREKPLEIGLICLIALVLVIYFGLKPILRSLREANLNLAVKKQEFQKKQDKLENLKKAKSNLEALKGDLELMKKALPKTEDMPALLVQVEALTSQSGLSVSSFAPSGERETTSPQGQQGEEGAISQKVVQKAGVASLAFGLSTAGTYPALIIFLENVEKNLRPTSVSSVNISGGRGDQPLSINLNMVSYYQK